MLQLQSVTSQPDTDSYDNCRAELDKYDIENIEKHFPDIAGIYDYRTGCYSGSGYLIGVFDSKWYAIPLGHCSCYGPLEDCHHSITYTKEEIISLVENLQKQDITQEVRQEFLTFINNH